MRRTEVRRVIHAGRARLYQALLDPALLAQWKVPHGMTLTVHEFEPREGGRLRISLAYDDHAPAGKTSAHTDTYRGRFVRLIPDELIVEEDEFETTDPAVAGAMTITIRLLDCPGGTELVASHEPVPPGVSLADNERGWNMALDKLSALVERDEP
ncbi:MAG: Activator of Hsp90 ATPase 1 family protein [Gemmatimonadetes bacterium]|nr:Activator of Hsp90 ATPase 1 family protein [Gemmatimonadota bacterium]